jgi:hypothetical protein
MGRTQRRKASPADVREREALLRLVDEAFDRRAWHGPNLRGSIRGVTAAEAAWRPGPGRHCIRELVVHAAYWKYAVRRRLTGERRGSFDVAGSNWFPRPEAADDKGWQADVRLLLDAHQRLRAAIAALDPATLHGSAAGSRQKAEALIRGIAFHDVYHAGQIQALKRLQARG